MNLVTLQTLPTPDSLHVLSCRLHAIVEDMCIIKVGLVVTMGQVNLTRMMCDIIVGHVQYVSRLIRSFELFLHMSGTADSSLASPQSDTPSDSPTFTLFFFGGLSGLKTWQVCVTLPEEECLIVYRIKIYEWEIVYPYATFVE